jgi:hypothetical protein
MTAVVLIAIGVCMLSVLVVTIFTFGGAIGYRRGFSEGRRDIQSLPNLYAIVLDEALSDARRT